LTDPGIQRKLREEEERRQAEEVARLRELDSHVARYIQSKQLESFIQEFKTRFEEGSYSHQAKEDFGKWVLWANAYADRIDPIFTAIFKLTKTAQKDR
jgi:hypothetical protein